MRERFSIGWRTPVGLALLAFMASACAAGSQTNEDADSLTAGFNGGAGFNSAAGTTGLPDQPLAGQAAAGISGAVAGTGGAAGTVSPAGTGGTLGPAGTRGEAGIGGAGGVLGQAGTMGEAGMMAAAGMGGDAGAGSMLNGDCCEGGDCLCRHAPPRSLSTMNGPHATANYELTTGTVYYPTDADPPFAAIAICPGFTNLGPEMRPWGPFYASHGFVLIATHTGPLDPPALRAQLLLGAIEELKGENTKSGSKLFGKLAGRYGTSGYSMGGGGTTIAAKGTPSLKSSIGLAAWGPDASGTTVPSLLLCGTSDGVAACSQSTGAYRQIPESTPKMVVEISGASHLAWFGPNDAGRGVSGSYALAFQKVFLEGDERWKPLLLSSLSGGSVTTNIQ
jgi:dienelactone hydrolase